MKGENLACGVAEQCSRHRRKGAHCLSEASLRAAGFGEPRRAPEGPCHSQNGFGHFCRNKSSSAAGTNHGNHRKPLGHHGLINEQNVFPLPTIVDHWTKN